MTITMAYGTNFIVFTLLHICYTFFGHHLVSTSLFRKLSQCSLTDEKIKQMWYVHVCVCVYTHIYVIQI
jgi:hypothetical protein